MNKNVLALLAIEREKKEDLSPARIRYLHGKAPRQIRQALQPYGYFRATIESNLVQTADGFAAQYSVKPGRPMQLNAVDVGISGEGEGDPQFSRKLSLHAGDALNQPAYEKLKQTLLSEAVDSGYLDARYDLSEIRVDMASYSASIRLYLDTGPLYRFGEIHFRQDRLSEEFLRRYLPFSPGETYNQDKILALHAALIDSDYFSEVEIRPLREKAKGGSLPLEVALSPNKPNRYRTGIGFSTDSGPRLRFDWLRRRIGRNGHQMSTEVSLSAPHSSLIAEYRIPLLEPTRDLLNFRGSLDHYDTEARKGEQLDITASHSVGLDNSWRRTLALTYEYEDFTVGEQTGRLGNLIPSIGWSRTMGDDFAYVRHGHKLHLQLRGATDWLLSDTNFIQAHAAGKLIRSLGEKWRLLTRLELGATWVEALTDLPASKRFYAGGDTSVRGHDLEELGAEDDKGEVLGGRYLAVGSLELERSIIKGWSGAVFYDAGNAFDPDFDNRVAQSVGVGLRWRSPIGQVRVDLATALSKDGHPWQLHIMVGPDL